MSKNSGDISGHTVNPARFLSAVAGAHGLACTSTWWTYPDIDAVIEQACEAHGGRYAYIGDLRLSPENTDNLVVLYAF